MSRPHLLICLKFTVVACFLSCAAQTRAQGRSASVVAELATATLDRFAPPNKMIGRIEVDKRGVFFDVERTAAAFRAIDSTAALDERLNFRREEVQEGSRTLLADCTQEVRGACAALGSGVYAWLEPVRLSDEVARVRLYLYWVAPTPEASKGRDELVTGGFLTGSLVESEWRRSSIYGWVFVKVHRMLAF